MAALRLVNRHDQSGRRAPSLDDLARQVQTANRDRVITITDAMTGEPLGEVPSCTPDDVAAAAERAREVQASWATRPIGERAEVLLRFHDLVLRRQEEVLDLIQQENGKARRHAFEEVIDVCLMARYYAHTAGRVPDAKAPPGCAAGAHPGVGAPSPQGLSSASSRRGTIR